MPPRPTPPLFLSTANRTPKKSSLPAFYSNKSIEQYAAKSSTPISLKHLINFGKHGRNKGEKEEADKLVKSGNFLRTELPTRLSHRLRDLQELPFIVASNPHMEHVYELYIEAFETIRRFPVIKDLEDNDRFCEMMSRTLDRHRVVIPELAIGVSESSPLHLPPQQLDYIMTRMLRSRISRRVITEQHIALTSQFRERQRNGTFSTSETEDDELHVGIVDTKLNAAEVVRKCAELVKGRGGPEGTVPVLVEGALDTSFAYIPEHLEFILFELIRNAAYATVRAHGPTSAHLHPIVVTVVHGPRELSVRVSDEGGGIAPYGGLSPPSFDPSISPLLPAPSFSGTQLAAARLDIFSFSHMRRLYQHHEATDETLETSGVGARALDAPMGTGTANATGRKTGIEVLKEVGKLAGTVQEQVDRQKRLKSEGIAGGSEDGEEGELKEEEILDAQMKSGIGLPLAKMFAEYFSGSVDIYTVQGFGSDAYARVSKFGNESNIVAGGWQRS